MPVRRSGLALALLLAACAAPADQLTIPDQQLDTPAPKAKPRDTSPASPKLVAYPGLEVSYVANADGETYHYRKSYYTFFEGEWFRAGSLRGLWEFIEMKYVPSDLFRVRGHLPPLLDEGRKRAVPSTPVVER